MLAGCDIDPCSKPDKCEQDGQRTADPDNCQSYFICSIGAWQSLSCQVEQSFDNDTCTCVATDSATCAQCPANGTTVTPPVTTVTTVTPPDLTTEPGMLAYALSRCLF